MPSPYEDARARLFDELGQVVPQVLGFGEEEAFLASSLGDEILAIRTPTTPAGGMPFLSLPEKDYRRKGPGSAIEQLHRMLRMLVRDRMWREQGGPAPSAALFRTNHFTSMLLRENKVDPQDLVDSVWKPVDIHDGWSEAREWQSGQSIPDVMRQSTAAQREVLQTPDALPWISGAILHDEIFIDAVALIPGGALYRLTRFGPTELRIPAAEYVHFEAPSGTQSVAKIRVASVPLGDPNPILRDLHFSGKVAVHKRSMRLMAEGEFLWESCYFGGHAQDEQRAEYNRRIRQLFMKRARIEAVIVKHLLPFADLS